VIGKLSLQWPQIPFHGRPEKFFHEGQRRNFAWTFQVADDSLQTDVHKALAPFYVNSHKKCTSLAAIAKYIAISYKIDHLQIFQAGCFFTKKQIAVVFTKTTIMSLFYLASFASIT